MKKVEGSLLTISALLFDVNGTLRYREPDSSFQQAAMQRILALLGKTDDGNDFWSELESRYKDYRNWMQSNLKTLSEAEIWSNWLLPNEPRDKVTEGASELMLAWLERKGRPLPIPGVEQTVKELSRRGYLLGLVSNSPSTLDVPRFVDGNGWKDYFKAIVLSSQNTLRKPAPEPFYEAARMLGVKPAQCAYIGNKVVKDVAGCKGAGYALGIMVQSPSVSKPEEMESIQPDITLASFGQLLDIFPGKSNP